MKLFLSIALALVPVLATASIVFVSYTHSGMKFVRPDKSGLVAFGVVVLGALLQMGKEVTDWREERKKAQNALDDQKGKDARALRGLENVCETVNFMLSRMAAGSKVAYPCQEDDIPNWYYVHNMYRSQLINHWTSRHAHLLEREDRGEWEHPFGILESWRSQLDGEIATLDLENERVRVVLRLIRNIQRQLETNWGMADLSELEKSNPRVVMDRVSRSLQEVISAAEFIYPILKRNEYAQGRQRCAEVQGTRFPNHGPSDLVFLNQGQQ